LQGADQSEKARQPSTPAGDRGDGAGGGEDPGEDREGRREEAHGDEDGDGLEPLGEAAEVEDALGWIALRREPALGRDHREGEEGRARADEGRDQDGGGQRVRGRIGQREAERHERVEDEVERDVEEGAPVGGAGEPRDFPVEPVGEPVREDQAERRQIPPRRQRRHRSAPMQRSPSP
jgi:hypothetical protein